jgi:hypothetical protein
MRLSALTLCVIRACTLCCGGSNSADGRAALREKPRGDKGWSPRSRSALPSIYRLFRAWALAIKHAEGHVPPVCCIGDFSVQPSDSEDKINARGLAYTRTITWRRVDFTAGTVRLEPGTTKNRQGRTIFLTRELHALLEEQWRRTTSLERQQTQIIPWVFHRNGKPIRSFKVAWQHACRRAGQPGRLFHDLRRTAVRNLIRRGIPERVAMRMSGHKPHAIFDRYYIVSEGDLREAARKLTGTISGTIAPSVACAG